MASSSHTVAPSVSSAEYDRYAATTMANTDMAYSTHGGIVKPAWRQAWGYFLRRKNGMMHSTISPRQLANENSVISTPNVAPVAGSLGHLGERRQLSLGHRAERDDGHQDIDHGHDHWGEQDGEGNVAARVLHVIGDLGDGRAAGERG